MKFWFANLTRPPKPIGDDELRSESHRILQNAFVLDDNANQMRLHKWGGMALLPPRMLSDGETVTVDRTTVLARLDIAKKTEYDKEIVQQVCKVYKKKTKSVGNARGNINVGMTSNPHTNSGTALHRYDDGLDASVKNISAFNNKNIELPLQTHSKLHLLLEGILDEYTSKGIEIQRPELGPRMITAEYTWKAAELVATAANEPPPTYFSEKHKSKSTGTVSAKALCEFHFDMRSPGQSCGSATLDVHQCKTKVPRLCFVVVVLTDEGLIPYVIPQYEGTTTLFWGHDQLHGVVDIDSLVDFFPSCHDSVMQHQRDCKHIKEHDNKRVWVSFYSRKSMWDLAWEIKLYKNANNKLQVHNMKDGPIKKSRAKRKGSKRQNVNRIIRKTHGKELKSPYRFSSFRY